MEESHTRQVKNILINPNRCIGSAKCIGVAPKAFEIDKEGVATVLATYLENTDDDLIKAAKECPSKAIVLLGQDNKEIPLNS